MKRRWLHSIILSIMLIGLAGCQSTYYTVWEKLGKEKRDLLKSQVGKARDEQQAASEQFQDVLSRIKEMYGFDGGELEQVYENLKTDYEACEDRAEAVNERIAKVDRIAEDLFDEWRREIKEMANPKLRAKSQKSLDTTRRRYAPLHKAMHQSKARMQPVLRDLRDYMLYLKHNLNAQAIGSLKSEAGDIEVEVSSLIADMQKSIDAAEEFLKTFE